MGSMHKQPLRFQAARGVAVAFAALWSTMLLPPARAASTQLVAPADVPDQPAYRKAIEDGLAEYDARHFEEARSLFRRAHQISPNARTFRGIFRTARLCLRRAQSGSGPARQAQASFR